MIPEQQLIQKIVELLDNDALERNPVVEEFAERYAELCQDIVARLQRCAEYLDRGMRSEAVHEATSAPSLLALVEIARFPELRKWGNAVTDLELVPFPQIPMDIVERLRQECATEDQLAPLLKEYRRCVYQGDRSGSICVLRRLREQDSENPSWPQNLRPLEEAQQPLLAQATEEALVAQDQRRLRELYDEMTHPQRVVAAPPDLLARVKDALSAERRASSRLQATELAQRVRVALTAEDRGAVATCLAEWDRLSADDAFAPEPRSQAAIAEARNTHQGWEQERAAEEAFRTALAEAQELLHSRRASSAAIEAKLAALRQTGRQVPEGLQTEVRRALAQITARRRRRARLVWVAALLLCTAGATAVGLILWRVAVGKARHARLTELTALFEGREYSRLKAGLDAIRQQDPAFYGTGEVRHLATAAEEALQRQRDAERQFGGVLAQLAQIRDSGYQATEEQVQALLAEARQGAPDEAADRAVNTWQSAWEDWRRRRRAEADSELTRVTALVRRVVDAKRLRPFATLADAEKALETLEPALRSAEPLVPRASTEVATAFQAASTDIDGWRREIEQQRGTDRQREERLRALRAQIDRALPDLGQYRALLEVFAKEFPEASETVAFQRVLSHLDAWVKAEALRAFDIPRMPPGQETVRLLRELLAAEAVRGSVWEADVRALVAWLDLNETVRLAVPALAVTKDDSLRLLALQYRPVGTQEWKPLYHPKPLMSRKETDLEGEFLVYWGLVHFSEADDQVPALVHTSKAFPGGFNTRRFEVRLEPRPQDNIVAHGKFLYSFVAEAVEAPELDVHLLHGIQSVIGEPGLEPVPRAWVLKRLVHLLAAHFGDTMPEALAMAETLRDLDTEVPWLNPRHPKVVDSSGQSAEVLKGLPELGPLVNRVQAGRALLASSLSRRVSSVGWLKQGRDGSLTPTFFSAGEGPVWILTAGHQGVAPEFKTAGLRGADGALVFKPGLEREVFEGQVLFAPADGRSARDVFDAAVPMEFRDQVRRPGAWPANDWPGK
jgi:hypothetical protein